MLSFPVDPKNIHTGKPLIDCEHMPHGCLWSDKIYYNELLHPKTLANVWDPNPAKGILANKNALQGYERFFGTLESETYEEKLNQGRKEMERLYRNKKARIDKWLHDPQLKSWFDKIVELSRKNKGAISFFNLFDPDATLSKRLQKLGLRFGYARYSRSSMALHVYSMEKFILIGDSVIAPKLQRDNNAVETMFVKVISDCNYLFVLLGMINHSVLKKTELRT